MESGILAADARGLLQIVLVRRGTVEQFLVGERFFPFFAHLGRVIILALAERKIAIHPDRQAGVEIGKAKDVLPRRLDTRVGLAQIFVLTLSSATRYSVHLPVLRSKQA